MKIGLRQRTEIIGRFQSIVDGASVGFRAGTGPVQFCLALSSASVNS